MCAVFRLAEGAENDDANYGAAADGAEDDDCGVADR